MSARTANERGGNTVGETQSVCCARCQEDTQVNLGTAKRPVLIVFDLDGTIADSRILARET